MTMRLSSFIVAQGGIALTILGTTAAATLSRRHLRRRFVLYGGALERLR
jgi:hypothetical protein